MAKEFTPEEISEYKDAFSLFDKDGSGSISTEELGQVMKNLGQSPSKEELDCMVKEVDTDGNGEICFDEFLEMMRKQVDSSDPEQDLREAFAVFDKDNSGTIDASELAEVMKTLGESLTAEEIQEMIKEADIDGDGQVSFEEFKKMMS